MLRTGHRLWRLLFWVAVVAGIVLSLWPQPNPPDRWLPGIDKVEHAASFAILTVIGLRAGYRSVGALMLGLLLLGGAIELAQGLFTTTRSAGWLDALADAIGIVLGWFAVRRAAARKPGAPSLGLKQEHRG